jgi:neutral ceramidase
MRSLILSLTMVFSVTFGRAPITAAAELQAGAAAIKVTPPAGMPMAGYYHARAADGVHDDLFAKVLVLKLGETQAALVSLDLISTTHEMVRAGREAVEEATGVPGQNVMISATHSHTGPVVHADGARPSLFGGSTEMVRRYVEVELPQKIAEGVKQAVGSLRPVKASWGRGTEGTIAFNRRFYMKDGTVGWNPGILNPNIVRPVGPIDPEVGVVYFEAAEKKPVGMYMNYTVHLDNIGGSQISADVPGVVARLLGEYKGAELVTVYTSGTCGDINHINVKWGERQTGFDNATRMGTILAAEVMRSFPKLKATEAAALRLKTETVKLPLAPIKPEDVERANEMVARRSDPAAKQPTFLEIVDALKVLDVHDRDGKPWEVEVQIFTLGKDVAWVSLPGEIFVEIGLAIKKQSPFELTMIAELANGSIGYIPTSEAYPQGNYEVVSARCAQGSGEMLVEAAVRMLKELHAE